MDEQMSIFDLLPPEQRLKPGEWVEEDMLGEKLSFDEIAQNVGNLIIIDMSTMNHAWYKIVLVESIYTYESGERRLIYYDGARQRGLINESYFNPESIYASRAWKIKGR